jgi:hypothetical protein
MPTIFQIDSSQETPRALLISSTFPHKLAAKVAPGDLVNNIETRG